MFRNPYNFENGKTAKNRVVVPAMASQTSTENGVATKHTVEHYAKLATSGAGIVF
jgi:2,4-dienoyl-CoA reductase-like NADH-dependent reductase (Old Yellow Enzyme family)